jgi:hypothetical protein
MAATQVLRMVFKDAADKSRAINVQDPDPEITGLDVEAVMDSILTKNVFETAGGDLVSKVKAEIVERDVTTLYPGA